MESKRNERRMSPVDTVATMVFTIVLEKIVSPYLEKVFEWIASKELTLTNRVYERIAKGVMVNIPFYIFLLIVVFASIKIINNKKINTKGGGEYCKEACTSKSCEHCLKYLLRIV